MPDDSRDARTGQSELLLGALADQFRRANLADIPPEELARSCLLALQECGMALGDSQGIEDTTPNVQPSPEAAESLNARESLQEWNRIRKLGHAIRPETCLQLGIRVLAGGEPLLAYDIFRQGLELAPGHVVLRQKLALALARSGAPGAAAAWLHRLIREGADDEETHGLLARTHKDLWQSANTTAEKARHLDSARHGYQQGYDQAVANRSIDGQIYNGINLATFQLLVGEDAAAEHLASAIRRLCLRQLEERSDYWTLATLGECALILNQPEEAAKHYLASSQLAGADFANLASTRRNAEIILRHRQQELEWLRECFPIPAIGVFSGHLIDLPGRPARFEHNQIEEVFAQLQTVVQEANVGIAYAAAACGADLLFLKAMADRESRIVLPLPRERFLDASVRVDPTHNWEPSFEAACQAAARIMVVNDFSNESEPIQIEYANTVMTGLAMLHANSLATQVVPITVWDEQPARGPGGTGSVVKLWRQIGWNPVIINPRKLGPKPAFPRNIDQSKAPQDSASDTPASAQSDREICAMLFADVVGYSTISEEEIPRFVKHFMGSIADCVEQLEVPPISSNTWGDAVYLVFASVREAGRAAIEIMEAITSQDWTQLGFQRQLSLRIGLHVGPVFQFEDPVTGKATHTGAHVSRAARIEPIAPPGEVYASEAFAAMAAAEQVTDFHCEYVGVTPMAKGYGEFPTYHVRRS